MEAYNPSIQKSGRYVIPTPRIDAYVRRTALCLLCWVLGSVSYLEGVLYSLLPDVELISTGNKNI